MTAPELAELLVEYRRALTYTDSLWRDLTSDEVRWRPIPDSSAIGWHLGHQAAVAHYLVRNLTAAEPPIDHALDTLMDSATEERQRGDLPDLVDLAAYRATIADRVQFRVTQIDRGELGAPEQLRRIATNMMMAIINHEYQHSKWISEVRSAGLGHPLPDLATSDRLSVVDGYLMVG